MKVVLVCWKSVYHAMPEHIEEPQVIKISRALQCYHEPHNVIVLASETPATIAIKMF